jgi:hypothetical protein
MRSIVFIAMLFCMGAASLLSGGFALYENIDFHLHGQAATMELANPSKKLTVPNGGQDIHLVDVRYVSPVGSVVVPQKRISGATARTLAAGGKIRLTYFTNDPHHVLYSVDDLPNPWWWLLVGLALLATFVFALRLARAGHYE